MNVKNLSRELLTTPVRMALKLSDAFIQVDSKGKRLSNLKLEVRYRANHPFAQR
jgi:hypothetical protein